MVFAKTSRVHVRMKSTYNTHTSAHSTHKLPINTYSWCLKGRDISITKCHVISIILHVRWSSRPIARQSTTEWGRERDGSKGRTKSICMLLYVRVYAEPKNIIHQMDMPPTMCLLSITRIQFDVKAVDKMVWVFVYGTVVVLSCPAMPKQMKLCLLPLVNVLCQTQQIMVFGDGGVVFVVANVAWHYNFGALQPYQ